MITPAYSPTATERVLPRMALDFTTGVLDSRVTIARALNTATRINSSGLVEIVNANLPRFDYNLTTLAPKGLLIEESRTNICAYSEDFLTGWGNFGGSYTPNSGTSPSGSGNATLVTNTSGGAFRYWPLVVVGTYTVSVWAKGITGTETLRLQSAPSGTVIGHGLTTQWARYTLTYTGTWTRFDIYMDTTAQQCLLWGAQVEAGAFATSYIPTSGATVTRNADVVSMTGTNFSSWYNATAGTLLAQANIFGVGVTAASGIVALSNGTSSENIAMFRFGGANNVSASIRDNSTEQAGFTVSLGSQPVKLAIAYAANNTNFAQNATVQTTDTTCTMPTVDRLLIGSVYAAGDFPTNGHIQKIQYWPQRVINAELQAFTK